MNHYCQILTSNNDSYNVYAQYENIAINTTTTLIIYWQYFVGSKELEK